MKCSAKASLLSLALALVAVSPASAAPDWTAVGNALGKMGAIQAGDVYRVGTMTVSDGNGTTLCVRFPSTLAAGNSR